MRQVSLLFEQRRITLSVALSFALVAGSELATATVLPMRKVTTRARLRSSPFKALRGHVAGKVPGVWRITRYASLVGPTVAIFLYGRLSRMYDQYQPFVTAKVKESLNNLASRAELSLRDHGSHLLQPLPNRTESPYATTVANEVIRLVNRQLRERAVISRIQMDDDQYEFLNQVNPSEVKILTEGILDEVLLTGPGKFLDDNGKKMVKLLVINALD